MVGHVTLIHDQVSQPVAFGFCLLQQNLPAVLSPAGAGFRDEASFRLRIQFPEEQLYV
ncbi:MAG: hypothetical protein HPY62_00880 [Bacteroidales bacterium]|nr:hypothetical protein [Bacteroidales bacterium]